MPASLDGVFTGILWSLPAALASVLSVLLMWREVQWLGAPDSLVDHLSLRVAQRRCWAGYAVRLGLIAAALVCAALRGSGPLLWAFAAVMISRWVSVPLLVWWRPRSHRRNVSVQLEKE